MDSPNNDNNKNKPSSTKGEKGLVILAIISIFIGVTLTFIIQNRSHGGDNNINVQAPDINVPANVNTPAVEDFQKFSISDPYTIYSNPYDDYSNNAFRLAIEGQFKDLFFDVNGVITDGQQKFVSLNFGLTSGILNAVRQNENHLDYEKTLAQRGVFTSYVDFSLNLLTPATLATSKDEFLSTKKQSKSVIFWDSISPTPNVFTMLIAPFNANGSYGGVAIERIELRYRCDGSKDSCRIALCNKEDLFTACLEKKFGKKAAIDWCERTQQPGCENL